MKNKKRKINKAGNPCQTQQLNNSKSVQKTGNTYDLGRDEIYRRNLKALETVNPELVGRVRGATISNYELVYTGPNTPPTLKIKSCNMNYYKAGDPLKDAEEQVQALGLKNTRLAVFLGMGLGYELLYYFNQMANKQNTNYILVIERDLEMFKAALKTVDLSHLLSNSRLEFIVGLPEEKLYVQLRNYLAENSRFIFLKAINAVYHPSSLLLYKDYYFGALKHLRESGTHQVLHFGNDPHDSIIGVENMMDNINEIIFNPGINLLFSSFKNKPGIVVATGPSLNKNKHLLKGIEEKALIVAADASLKVLLDIGVKPHLVTSLERVPATVKLLEGFKPEQVKNVYFAGCPVVRKEAYEVYPGPRVIVYRNFDHFKWLGIERGILNIQLSAGNMAFKLCEALGCNPIILIGQDLAFSRDGYTHAGGTILGDKQDFFLKGDHIEVKGNDGSPIKTTATWYSFLKSYELDVAGFDGQCINSTEGGAYIEGTEVIPFQDAINNYVNDYFYPLEIIETELNQFSKDDAEHDYNQVTSLIEGTKVDMQGIIEECEKGFMLYNNYKTALIKRLSGADGEDDFKEIVTTAHEKVIKPKNRITKEFGETYQLYFMHVLQSFNIKFEMEMIAIPEKHNSHEKALAEITLRHGEWYSVVKDLATIMLNLLCRAEVNMLTNETRVKNPLRRVSI